VLVEHGKVYFVPSVSINPARYSSVVAPNGMFNVIHSAIPILGNDHVNRFSFNCSGWPIELTPTHARDQIINAKLDSGVIHIWNLAGEWAFMAAVPLRFCTAGFFINRSAATKAIRWLITLLTPGCLDLRKRPMKCSLAVVLCVRRALWPLFRADSDPRGALQTWANFWLRFCLLRAQPLLASALLPGFWWIVYHALLGYSGFAV
jgi:hypothetical protein